MTGLYWAICLIVPIYVVWRFLDAKRAWKRVASDLDAYLGEDHPELFKAVLYSMFEDSMKHTVVIRFAFFALFKSKNKRSSAIVPLATHLEAATEEQEERLARLLVSILLVNVRLSPVTYLALGTLGYLFSLAKALRSKSEKTVDSVLRPRTKLVEDFASSVYSDRIAL